MAKPCNQSQIKKFPWTPERARALMNEALQDFFYKGKDFSETINGLSARHGIKREIIAEGLQAAKGVPRRLTDEMWALNRQKRVVENAARRFTTEFNKPGWQKKAEALANVPRRVVLSGHFAAFTKSHLSDQLFYNPKYYANNFTKSWSLINKDKAQAQLDREIDQMQHGTEDKAIYDAGIRSGLNVSPGGGGNVGKFRTETTEAIGTPKETRSAMAFDRLRLTRYGIWKNEYNRLSPEERDMNNPQAREGLQALAHVINNDTGTTAVRSKVLNFLFLAPRLFPAQLAHSFVDIPKALWQTGMGFKYNEAAPAMRYVARKTAILAGTYTGMMAANEGLGIAVNAAQGKKLLTPNDFTPNIGSPERRDWLRPKLFGFGVPISPTVELLKVPIQMIAAARAARQGESPLAEALLRGLDVVLGRQNPLFAIIEQAALGQETGTGRPLPKFFGHEIGFATQAEGPTHPRQTWTEFLGSKMPIWMANYSHEVYDEMREQGMDHASGKAWIEAMTRGTLEFITSYHGVRSREDFGFPTKMVEKGQPGYGQYRGQVNEAMKRYKDFKHKEEMKPKPKELFGAF